jgi:hypothetical protein
MKKTILTIVISFISSSLFGQVNQESRDFLKERLSLLERDLEKHEARDAEREKLAGHELKKFANHHYIGTGLGVGGGVMIVAGYSMMMRGQSILNSAYIYDPYYQSQINNGNNKIITGTYLAWTGQLLTLAGLVYKIEAPLHIKKAGLILSGNGVGINVRLN